MSRIEVLIDLILEIAAQPETVFKVFWLRQLHQRLQEEIA